MTKLLILIVLSAALAVPVFAGDIAPDVSAIYRITDCETKMVNGLWGENPQEMQIGNGRTKVVLADLKGPGIITMIHFALPQTMKMDRDTVLRIFWDGEKNPSVEAPMVDFFCDPNGALERVESLLVNKKRGWNCYFPMPFAKSARVELEYDNPRYPGGNWSMNPCYSYIMYREVKSIPADSGYLHATWRQKTVSMLKGQEYEVFEAQGKGHFIGWNMSVRGANSPTDGYYVDENEKFYVDGEADPSIEWQGIEDSFGFSWGFPEQANEFPYTGYQPYYKTGAAAFRFCLNDRIAFRKSIRFTVGFGKEELKSWQTMFKDLPSLQFSSVAYWYQTEPHKPFTPLLPARNRRPANLAMGSQAAPVKGQTLALNCGDPSNEIEYLADGWDFVFRNGYSFNGSPWTSEIKHCWADFKSLQFDVVCPKGASGTLRLYILDGDNFGGGRRETISVAGREIGTFDSFQTGRWIDIPISASDTSTGSIPVTVKSLNGNAVVSMVRFVE